MFIFKKYFGYFLLKSTNITQNTYVKNDGNAFFLMYTKNIIILNEYIETIADDKIEF